MPPRRGDGAPASDCRRPIRRSSPPGGDNNTLPFARENVPEASRRSEYSADRLAVFTAWYQLILGMSYSASKISGELPVPTSKLDPYEPAPAPVRGMLGALNLGWSYSNAQRFLWSHTAEKGFSTSANLSFTDSWLGSSFSGFAASTDLAYYLTMPWLRHHTVTQHGNLGTSSGNLPGRGPFFVDIPVIDTVRDILIQGGVVLRGYEPVTLVGRNVALFNGEYHFPIANIDRGLSTLRIFFQRVSGNVFVDYGSAFNEPETAKFKTGVGGELWFDSTLAYVVGFTFRLGYARGLASQAIDKIYFVAAVPY